ncbi:hypothetical protein [Solirubrobacter soli]|uniref:hypothetical protein n=1 Tax=Solirubrobacter soli TaxID=363832 RepID=UPI000410060F|nr:hypothetical protein [Solirubrobacter soli]
MRSHPTAGQATLEYIAAVALMAALLLVAAPAVGAPDIGRSVAEALRHGICLVGGDICSSGDARRAGLAPCALKSDLTGAEGSLTIVSVELGAKWTLLVSRRSDGSVAVVRSGGGSAGLTGGVGLKGDRGPVELAVGADGAIRARIMAARGWLFPDTATAKRFLEHAAKNSFEDDRWPPAWKSVEAGGEAGGSVVVDVGDKGADSTGQAGGVSVGGGAAIGWRWFADGSSTRYSRLNAEGSEVNVALLPSPREAGKAEWLTEYTRGPGGEPRELVLRTAISRSDNRLTETVAHLDLSDPANYAAARPFLGDPISRTFPIGAARRALLDRVATSGTIERLTSDVNDTSRGLSVDVKAGIEFGLGGKKLSVHRTLVSATVQRGAIAGKRLDCVPSGA